MLQFIGALCCPCALLPTHYTYCDRTFSVAYLLMDLDSASLFPPGIDVTFTRSTKEPAPARVIGTLSVAMNIIALLMMTVL